MPLRHDGLLAGHRRARAEPVARHDRPAAVPSARRPAAASPPRARRADAFAEIDLPRAAVLLAQATGRLIRTRDRSRRRRRVRLAARRRPATGGTSCARSRRCAARVIATKSKRSCARCADATTPVPSPMRRVGWLVGALAVLGLGWPRAATTRARAAATTRQRRPRPPSSRSRPTASTDDHRAAAPSRSACTTRRKAASSRSCPAKHPTAVTDGPSRRPARALSRR